MKIKKKKFVVGSLLATCSLAIVGSITSTFAWYTYSTKTTLTYSGLSAGKTSNLQMRFARTSGEADEWRSAISLDEIIQESLNNGYAGSELSPVTPAEGITAKGEDCLIDDRSKTEKTQDYYKLYGAPESLHPSFTKDNITYKDVDSNTHYVWLRTQLQFRCVNPNDLTEKFAKSVYVSYLDAKVSDNETKDVTKGLRIHFYNGGVNNYLVAPGYKDEETNRNIPLHGKLKLGNAINGVWCEVDPSYEGGDYETGWYRMGMSLQAATALAAQLNGQSTKPAEVTYSVKEHYDAGVLNGTDSQGNPVYRLPNEFDKIDDVKEIEYGNGDKTAIEGFLGVNEFVSTFEDGKVKTAKCKICDTSKDSFPVVTLSIFLEGWDPAVIDSNYKAKFDVAMQFECEKLNNND